MPTTRVNIKSRLKPESIYLKNFAGNVASQQGEDGIRKKIFGIMGTTNEWCVEFGAWDGKHLSNSWDLLNNFGWKGVLIEGSNEKFNELRTNYYNRDNVATINSYVSHLKDGDCSIDAILKETEIPADFDFITIDVDGLDWHIWDSMTSYRPRLVCIEFNPTIPNNIYFVQDPDPSVNQGSSLLAMIELGKDKGYELVATTAWNAFFVTKEDYPVFKIGDNSIDSMHSIGDKESYLFQLYDGTLVLLGNDRLAWRGQMQIHQEDIQVLPRALRRFL